MNEELPTNQNIESQEIIDIEKEIEENKKQSQEVILIIKGACLEGEIFSFAGISEEGMKDLIETNTLLGYYDENLVKDIDVIIEKLTSQGLAIIPGKNESNCVIMPADYMESHFADYTSLKDDDGNILMKNLDLPDVDTDLAELYYKKKESEQYTINPEYLNITDNMNTDLLSLVTLMKDRNKLLKDKKNLLAQ